jgi:hypothetical protein
MREYKKK